MRLKITLYLLITIVALVSISKGELVPIAGTPVEINNIINYSDPNSYGIYQIYLYNPTNETYNFYFTTITANWEIRYGKNNEYVRGVIYPNETKIVDIYIRPETLPKQMPVTVVVFNTLEKSYSYTLYFIPYVIYHKEVEYNQTPVIKELVISVVPSTTTITPGESVVFYVSVENPNNFSQPVNIEVISEWGFIKKFEMNATPGVSTVSIPIPIPTSLNVTQIKFYVTVNQHKYEFSISVNLPESLPTIIKKDNVIEIVNNNTRVLVYKYVINASSWDLIFNIYSPEPKRIVKYDGRYGLEYEIVLLPYDSFKIVKVPNYLMYTLIILLIALIVIQVILLLKPAVYIRKDIVNIDAKEKVLSVSVRVVNNSFFKLKNVKIRDYIPKGFEVINYQIKSPDNVYKVGDKTTLEWVFDSISRKEDIVVSYRIKITEDMKSIELDRAEIIYDYLFMKDRSNRSNKFIVRILS